MSKRIQGCDLFRDIIYKRIGTHARWLMPIKDRDLPNMTRKCNCQLPTRISFPEQNLSNRSTAGYLVLADISGYTSFVATTEIEHADLALSLLLETIVEKINSLLTISQLEGDAVFAYIEENKLQEAQSLLQLIDQTYLAFREKALALHAGST